MFKWSIFFLNTSTFIHFLKSNGVQYNDNKANDYKMKQSTIYMYALLISIHILYIRSRIQLEHKNQVYARKY